MPITHGSLSGRFWRVTEALPPHFTDVFSRNLKRQAFRPIDPAKGDNNAQGWVNLRQPLDSDLSLAKVQFGNVIAVALRMDKLSINMRLFRARVQQETELAVKGRPGRERLSDEQLQALEDKVKQEMLKNQTPAMSIYEMAWSMDTGLVIIGATSESVNQVFVELFQQTFNLSLEPQQPYFRALRWAGRQRMDRELRETLPSPFSPKVPAEVVDATALASGDE